MSLKRLTLALALVGCAHARTSPPATATNAAAEAARDPHDVEPYVSPRAYEHYLNALLARGEDDLPAAVQALREALLYDPESPHLHTVLGEVLLRQGRVADAEAELRAAIYYDPGHAPAHLLLGRIAAARQSPLDAEKQLRAAIDGDPDDAEARRELVRLYLSVGNFAAAQEAAGALAGRMRDAQLRAQHRDVIEAGDGAELVAAERLREQAAAAWVDVARALAQQGDKAGAGRAFGEARAAQPSDPEALLAEGAFLEQQRRAGEARELYLRLLSQRPEGPEVLAALARVALEDGDVTTTRAHARKLIALAAALAQDHSTEHDEERRELAGALARVAVPLLGAHRSGEAQLALEAALRLYPDHPELSFYRALALMQRGRPRDAAVAFDALEKRLRARRGEQATPPLIGIDAQAWLLDVGVLAAVARGRAGDTHEALKRLRAMFAERPQEAVALALVEAFERAGRTVEAEPVLAGAARGAPGDEGLLYALATAQDRIGDRQRALSTMRRVLAVQPAHAGALNYIGYTLAEQGSPESLREAEALLSRAIDLRPDDGAIADSYGFCLLRLGRPTEALKELRRADHLSPGDPVILAHLGDALLAGGKREDALDAFRRALSGLTRQRASTAPREQAALDPSDRLPEPGDAQVRSDLVRKLRALSFP